MTTKFSDIVYDDENHGYRIGDKNLVSVTTAIKQVAVPFDRHTISLRSAEKAGVSQAEILRQWEEKSVIGRDKGTRLHQYVEDAMAGRVDPILRGGNARIPEMDAFDTAWAVLRDRLDAKLVKQEFVVGDAQYGVAGRVDCLLSLLPPETPERVACVFDWKTGKLDVDNRYRKLLPPFQNYDDCKLNQYSVQLSLYRLIIERNKGMKLGDGYILHLRPDGSYQIHRARDLRAEIHEWLKDGLPASAQGDPATEKKAQELAKAMDMVDREFCLKLSERTRHDLRVTAERVRKACEAATDYDDEF